MALRQLQVTTPAPGRKDQAPWPSRHPGRKDPARAGGQADRWAGLVSPFEGEARLAGEAASRARGLGGSEKWKSASDPVRAFTILVVFLFFVTCAAQGLPSSSRASEDSPDTQEAIAAGLSDLPETWLRDIQAQWGGHFKIRGVMSWPGEASVFQPVGAGTFYDGNIEGRLKSQIFLGKWGVFETHYEVILLGGDTWRKGNALESLFPDLSESPMFFGRRPEDERRVMDLTKTLVETDDYILYHRLDRLYLALKPEWGVIKIGRQAITWGNGLLFNPMDLFNPFSPTDIERDYKIGDDIASAQFPILQWGDFQALYVPRRKPSSGDVQWNQSSLAGKFHFALGTTEFDLMAAKHFEDHVVGLGSMGYLGDAAWRVDVTWTFLRGDAPSDDYLSLVANMDYSWVWWGKNFYGFMEFFYNGLGEDEYPEAIVNPDIVERLDRGELFTLGRPYLSGHIRVELHPLFNVLLTVINNLGDPSGIVQPRATWDITQDVQITLGGNIFFGGSGTEYGGFNIPGTNLTTKPSNIAFLWYTYYF